MSFFGRLMSLDATLSAALVPDESRQRLQSFLKIIGHSCDSWYWLIGLIVFWIFAAGEARAKAFLLAFILGVLAVFVLGIKFLIRRPRPEGEWGQIYRITDPHSFPSGHAARAVVIAVFFSQFQNLGLTILIWIWAILVCYSRVALRLHYVSDVIIGGLIGAGAYYPGVCVFSWLLQTLPCFEFFAR